MELGTYRLAEINKGGGLRQKAVGLATQYLNGIGQWVDMPTSMTPTAHTHNYAGSDEAGGPAKTATKLATTRALTIGNTAKNFDGSAAVSWTLADIGANQWKDGQYGTGSIQTNSATATGLRSGDVAKPYVYWGALAGQNLKAGGLAGTDQKWMLISPSTVATYAYGGVEYTYNNATANYVFLLLIDSADFIGSTTHPLNTCRIIANAGTNHLISYRTILTVGTPITGNVYPVIVTTGNSTAPSGINYTESVCLYAPLKSSSTNYTGNYSVASGQYSVASGNTSVASGAYSVASGNASVASGYASVASGNASVASGYASVASGNSSVASGSRSVASGYSSVASGNTSVASGYSSVASGDSSVALGDSSLASGERTIAGGSNQTVIGKWNLANTTDAFIIGNGTSISARSNCMTVDFSGNMSLAGSIAVGVSGDITISKNAGLDRLAYFDSSGVIKSSASYTLSSFASAGHNHDATYLKLSGGTVTGQITLDTTGGIYKSGWDGNRIAYFVSGDLTTSADYTLSSFALADHNHDSEYAAASHTHLYAGSSSAGGAASSATRLEILGTCSWGSIDNITGNGLYFYADTSTSGRWYSYGSVFQFSNTFNPVPGTSQHWVTQILSSTGDKIGVRWRTNTENWSSVQGIITSVGGTFTGGISGTTGSFSGAVTAGSFSGVGSSITSLNASNLSSGTVPIGRLPVGTESTQVSAGDHTHSGYAASTHNHDSAYSAIGHDHSGTYALASHTHSGYATSTHNHDATYLKLSGGTVTGKITLDTNGGIYKSGWDGNRIAYFVSGDLTTSSEYTLSSFALAGHTHSGYAASTHSHSIPDLYCGVPNIVPGRILISGTGTWSNPTWLDAGTNGKILGWTSGAPAWVDAPSGTSVSAANPTASVGLTAVNGSATTFMRSDAAPKLDVTIAPTWTGNHTFNGLTKLANVGIGVDPSTSYKLYVVEDKKITTAGSYIGSYLIAKYNTELSSGTRQGIALLGQLWATGGTLTEAKGLDFKIYVPSGTVTEATAINAVIQTDGGSIGTAYALKLSRTGTAPTVANYGIYQDDSAATNVFNGYCEFNGGTNLVTGGRARNIRFMTASGDIDHTSGTDTLIIVTSTYNAALTLPTSATTGDRIEFYSTQATASFDCASAKIWPINNSSDKVTAWGGGMGAPAYCFAIWDGTYWRVGYLSPGY